MAAPGPTREKLIDRKLKPQCAESTRRPCDALQRSVVSTAADHNDWLPGHGKKQNPVQIMKQAWLQSL